MNITQKIKSLFGKRELNSDSYLTPTYGRRWNTLAIDKKKIPSDSMSPEVAFRIVADEMNLEGI